MVVWSHQTYDILSGLSVCLQAWQINHASEKYNDQIFTEKTLNKLIETHYIFKYYWTTYGNTKRSCLYDIMPIPLGIIFSSTQIGKTSQSHSQLNDLKPRKEGWLFGEFSLTWGKWLLCQIRRRRKKRYTISKDDRLPGLVISYGEQLNWASNFGYHSLRVIGLILATPSDLLF